MEISNNLSRRKYEPLNSLLTDDQRMNFLAQLIVDRVNQDIEDGSVLLKELSS